MGWAKKSQKVKVGTKIDLRAQSARPKDQSFRSKNQSIRPKNQSLRSENSSITFKNQSLRFGDSAVAPSDQPAPELARRRQHRRSTIKSGRTIGEQREKLETKSERQAAHRKSRRRRRTRVVFVSLTFIIAAVCIAALYLFFFRRGETPLVPTSTARVYEPTIQIVDEDASAAGSAVTDRVKQYVGQAEADFRDLGYTPLKAVVPSGAIREVDFYLKDQPGFIKLFLDRPTAESVEDADRLLRYLKEQGIATYEYLDVRLPLKAYWK